MYSHRLISTFVLTTLMVSLSWPVAAFAQGGQPEWDVPPRLVEEPEGIARLRAEYQGMTEEELVVAGFQVDQVCVSAAMVGESADLGDMGHHATNPKLMGRQFPAGEMDPENPPIVLLGPDKRVVGVEWEAANVGQEAPELFGQTVNLGPGHPHAEQPHYMLHAYFRTNGKVLFGDFDPQISCPAMPNAGAGGMARRSDFNPMVPAVALAVVVLATGAWVRHSRA